MHIIKTSIRALILGAVGFGSLLFVSCDDHDRPGYGRGGAAYGWDRDHDRNDRWDRDHKMNRGNDWDRDDNRGNNKGWDRGNSNWNHNNDNNRGRNR